MTAMAATRTAFWVGCLAAGVLGALLARCDLPTQGWMVPARSATSRDEPVPARTPGPVSIGFAQDMSLHHEQALVMARLALQRGTPAIRLFAQGIHDAQLKELGLLQGWLMLWDAPAASDTATMDWMKDVYWRAGRRNGDFEALIAACTGSGSMPGVATAQQLEQLAGQRDAAFDRLFLQLMSGHHRGAIVMAQFAYEHAEHEAVRGFAASMGAEQRQEWMRMAGLARAASE